MLSGQLITWSLGLKSLTSPYMVAAWPPSQTTGVGNRSMDIIKMVSLMDQYPITSPCPDNSGGNLVKKYRKIFVENRLFLQRCLEEILVTEEYFWETYFGKDIFGTEAFHARNKFCNRSVAHRLFPLVCTRPMLWASWWRQFLPTAAQRQNIWSDDLDLVARRWNGSGHLYPSLSARHTYTP